MQTKKRILLPLVFLFTALFLLPACGGTMHSATVSGVFGAPMQASYLLLPAVYRTVPLYLSQRMILARFTNRR